MDPFTGLEGQTSAEAQRDLTQYVLLLLSDSNLPTGGFIASAGLESYVIHGLLSQGAQELHAPGPNRGQGGKQPSSSTLAQTCSAFLSFLGSSLDNYARSSLPFLADAHALASRLAASSPVAESPPLGEAGQADPRIQTFIEDFTRLDNAYHSMVLNHVARRASCAQGIAFLTLFSKAFAQAPELANSIDVSIRTLPPSTASRLHVGPTTSKDGSSKGPGTNSQKAPVSKAIDALKLAIRRGTTPGHLPLSFGVFTAALGLELRSTAHLHLFLQARALLSTAIRLNVFGPYLAHQMLLFHVRTLVDSTLAGIYALGTSGDDVPAQDKRPCTGLLDTATATGSEGVDQQGMRAYDQPVKDDDPDQGWAWDWPDEGAWGAHVSLTNAPTTTWPLGELVQARHDQLQSRLFNS
ncbi:hypothetical protein A4X09_0g6130 [Tilletia walkeri]|uniref:Uncharacterized protein n=1 Tax=Tilletia walkeri TaxID=117179 RepID=A0A8X7T2H0_9BASI|nr:hypothetical protein A4X09_0g6130 [Tilletia walkeri]